MEAARLREIAREVRIDSLRLVHKAQSGHPGGSLSEAEILVVLYFHVLHHFPDSPHHPNRDRFILSKGHACPAFYAVLARAGYFERAELRSFRQINGLLQGHTTRHIPGVEMSGGSLGQGLSFGVGCALSAKADNKSHYVYVLLGDGEVQEGQIWEAAMTAAHHRLDNIIAIVDKNKIQNDWFVDQTKVIDPLTDKWKAFGWHVLEVDGHNIEQLISIFKSAKELRAKPIVIIANTIKGKGVSFMENNPHFHGAATNEEQFKKAMDELGGTYESN